jgi:hypothetical protein
VARLVAASGEGGEREMETMGRRRGRGGWLWPLAGLSMAAGLAGAPAWADESVALNRDPAATEAFWSEERLRRSEPLAMPVKTLGGQAAGIPLRPQAMSAAQLSGPGAEASIEVGSALATRLYWPDEEELVPQDAAPPRKGPMGKAVIGAAFTHGRVFPPAAVRQGPYRQVGKLFTDDGECSAAVIERRLILTAGHCVFDPETGRRFNHFLFVPAHDRGQAPFGRWVWAAVWAAKSWRDGNGTFPNGADFAIIELRDRRVGGNRRAIGDVVGWFGWLAFSSPEVHLTSLGLPGNLDRGERLQQTQAQVFAIDEPNAFEFGSYHSEGASGGPVVIDFGVPAIGQPSQANLIIGVNSYEYLDDWVIGASILNEEFVDLLRTACARRAGNCRNPPPRTATSGAPGG